MFAVRPLKTPSAVAVTGGYIASAMPCTLTLPSAIVTIVTRFAWMFTAVTMVTGLTGADKGAVGIRAVATIQTRVG